MMLLTLFCLLFGLYGFLFSTNEKLNQISVGLVVLGIGILGMLKMAIEMAAYHSQQKLEE